MALRGVLNKGEGRQPGCDVGKQRAKQKEQQRQVFPEETGMQDAGPGCRMQDHVRMQDQNSGYRTRTDCRTGMQDRDVEEKRPPGPSDGMLGDGFCPARNPSHLPFQR